jgi:hypothetical protein
MDISRRQFLKKTSSSLAFGVAISQGLVRPISAGLIACRPGRISLPQKIHFRSSDWGSLFRPTAQKFEESLRHSFNESMIDGLDGSPRQQSR